MWDCSVERGERCVDKWENCHSYCVESIYKIAPLSWEDKWSPIVCFFIIQPINEHWWRTITKAIQSSCTPVIMLACVCVRACVRACVCVLTSEGVFGQAMQPIEEKKEISQAWHMHTPAVAMEPGLFVTILPSNYSPTTAKKFKGEGEGFRGMCSDFNWHAPDSLWFGRKQEKIVRKNLMDHRN